MYKYFIIFFKINQLFFQIKFKKVQIDFFIWKIRASKASEMRILQADMILSALSVINIRVRR